MAIGVNTENLDVLITAKLSIDEYNKNLKSLQQKVEATTKDLNTANEKIEYINKKNVKVLTEGAKESLDRQKSLILAAQKSLKLYESQTYELEKQLVFVKRLAAAKQAEKVDRVVGPRVTDWTNESDMVAQNKAALKQIASDNQAARAKELANLKRDIIERAAVQAKQTSQGYGSFGASTINTATRNTGSFTSVSMGSGKAIADERIAQNKRLEESMKQLDNTSKNTFPHKVSTTAQYMAAGAIISGIATSIYGTVTAIMESDKAFNMFQGILEMSAKEAKGLQKDIFAIGTAYGGSISDLNESALALGRAGLKSNELASALKIVSQASLVSGDSLASVTELLVSWKTVHPEETIAHLGDMMVKVANDSLASFDDFKTMTNYLLTSTETMGMSAKSTIALAGAWRNLGKGASTTGTEIRRFMDQVSNGSDEVNKAYGAMGINLDKVQKGLAQGGKVAEATMIQIYRNLAEATKLHPAAAAEASAKLQTLDKATFNSNIALSKQVEISQGVMGTAYEKMVTSAENSSGALEAANKKIIVSYSVLAERIKNTLVAGVSTFADSFKDGFIGAGTTVGDLDAKIEEFNVTFSNAMKSMGEAAGWAASKLAPIVSHIDDIILAYGLWKGLVLSGSIVQALGLITTSILEAKAAQVAFNLAAYKNPYIIAGAAIVAGVVYMRDQLNSAEDDAKRIYDRQEKAAKEQSDYYKTTDGQAVKLGNNLISLNKTLIALEAQKLKVGKEQNAQLDKRIASTKTIITNNEKALAALSGVKTTGTKKIGTVDLSGTAASKKEPKGLDKQARELFNVSQGAAKLAEETYFVNSNITSQLEQQRYHVTNTIPQMQKGLSLIRDKELREIEANKLQLDRQKTLNDSQAIEKAILLENSKRIDALSIELELAGNISDLRRIELADQQRLQTASENYMKTISSIGSDEKLSTEQRAKNKELRDSALVVLEKEVVVSTKLTGIQKEQLKIKEDAYKFALDTAALGLQILQATTGEQQIKLEQLKIERDMQAEILKIQQEAKKNNTSGSIEEKKAVQNAKDKAAYEKAHVSGAETYNQLLTESNVAFERNNTTAKQFMRITDDGIQAMTSGLTTFFDRNAEGYGKWATLRDTMTKQIIESLMRELVINQMIAAVKMGMSAASGGLSSLFMAKGGITNYEAKGDVNYLAKGGYANSIVKKPTYVAKGTIAGEAGAEAVLPLQRDSQGRLGVNAGSGGSGTSQNITISIKNEAGEELKVTQSEARTDMSGMVIDIVLDAINRNKRGMRDAVRG